VPWAERLRWFRELRKSVEKQHRITRKPSRPGAPVGTLSARVVGGNPTH
jgi:hypothetical protein